MHPLVAAIVIESCKAFVTHAGKAAPKTAVTIRFHARDTAARAVRFVVETPGATQRLDDVGRFAPGVTVEHTFMLAAPPPGYRPPEVRCTVESVIAPA